MKKKRNLYKLGLTCLIAASMSLACPIINSASAQATSTDLKSVPDDLKVGYETITEEQAADWLEVFVEGGFEGRGTGQDGYIRAAHYVSGKLAEFGFAPIGDNGTYFQNLPFVRITPDVDASSVTVGDMKFSGSDQIGFTQFQDTDQVSGEAVFINADGQRVSIPNPPQLQGKLLIVKQNNVGRAFIRSLLQARPAGIIQVTGDEVSSNTLTVREGGRISRGRTLSANVTSDVAAKLAAAAGVDNPFAEIKDEIKVTASSTEVTIDLKAIRVPATVPNVVGWMEGSDPELKDEYIVIGGHLDHLGLRGDSVYPGADDNGSGSTAILQVAQALHENPVKPKRSILYIAFAAEELGLLGSDHFVENPLKPLDKCICMFNIDMVGRNEEKDNEPASENEDTIHLIGSQRYSSDLHKILLGVNESVGFVFEYDEEENIFGRSDHYNFFKKGIPVAFLWGGFNPHYHQTTDGMNDINFRKIVDCARLYYLAIYEVADHGRFKQDQ